MTYRSIAPDALAWRVWDGEYVVLNAYAGNIHLLDEATAAVLLAVHRAAEALTVPQIAALVPPLDGDSDEAHAATIREMLTHLRRLGLVRPASR